MDCADRQLALFEAMARIERSILPIASTLLDTLLDAAALARAGVDAELHAAELRRIAGQAEALTLQVQALLPTRVEHQDYAGASAGD